MHVYSVPHPYTDNIIGYINMVFKKLASKRTLYEYHYLQYLYCTSYYISLH